MSNDADSSSMEILHSEPMSNEQVRKDLQSFLKKSHVKEGLSCDLLSQLHELHDSMKSDESNRRKRKRTSSCESRS